LKGRVTLPASLSRFGKVEVKRDMPTSNYSSPIISAGITAPQPVILCGTYPVFFELPLNPTDGSFLIDSSWPSVILEK
jgi:hypothetical protein